jgi:hypothetical protein
MERVRQSNTAATVAQGAHDLHLELLFRKLVAAEEAQVAKPAQPRMGSLYLPAGWKPEAASSKQNAEAVKRAVLQGAAAAAAINCPEPLSAAMLKYSSAIPRCVAQIHLSSGRILLCDYAHLQPESFHRYGALAGLGTMIACSVVRCRYVRPSSKPAATLLRGFANRGPNLTDRVSQSGNATPGNNSPQRSAARTGGGLIVTQTESVVIAECPLPVLSAGATAFHRSALQHSRPQRWEEFHVPGGNASACTDWPRQCAVLYVSLGVPRLYLLDPLTQVPSAVIDLHNVRRLGPSERYLQAIELQDRTNCLWQISPEGLDSEDAREAPRRWLQTLAALCLPSTKVVHVLKTGYLQKRGQVNRAFKLRWFVLTSDLKLRYYKDDQAGIWKGTIDLSTESAQEASSTGSSAATSPNSTATGNSSPAPGAGGVVRFEKEIVVTMQSTQRMFKLQAEDVATAEDWLAALKDLLQSPFAASGAAAGVGVGLGEESRHSESLLEEIEAGDDDEGDDD